MELPRRIPYNQKWWGILGCILFFGLCFAGMAHTATHNTGGLIISGLLGLGPTGATVFYWIVAAMSGGFVLLALILATQRITSPKSLELGTDALLLPHGYFRTQTSRIAYSDIQSVSEVQVRGYKFLYITAGGVRFTIADSLLPNEDIYVAVKEFLASHAH